MLKFLVFSLVIISAFCDNDDNLLSVVVIYRHGDRTPIEPYPMDPYRNASYWPVGFGQLTNEGKLQQFVLGKWLRARYANFLPAVYSEKDIYIRATDVDRTLMSAEANLAGLYPPQSKQIWDKNVLWQPIPVHTEPDYEDNLLAMKKDCPKYNQLLTELFKTEFFVNISHENHDLYAYLTKYTGKLVSTLEEIEYLYNTLSIEAAYNLTLPEWTKSVYPNRLMPWARMNFAVPTWTSELARLKAGPIIDKIVEHFTNATSNVTDYRKALVFSGHDITIANVLNALGAFEYHCPPYASTILMELRQNQSDYSTYLNVFYKNSSQLLNITVRGCKFDCSLVDFIRVLEPVTISRAEWEIECQVSWLYALRLEGYQFLILFLTLLSLLSITVIILVIIKCYRQVPNDGAPGYMKLPNDEIA